MEILVFIIFIIGLLVSLSLLVWLLVKLLRYLWPAIKWSAVFVVVVIIGGIWLWITTVHEQIGIIAGILSILFAAYKTATRIHRSR